MKKKTQQLNKTETRYLKPVIRPFMLFLILFSIGRIVLIFVEKTPQQLGWVEWVELPVFVIITGLGGWNLVRSFLKKP